MHTAIHKGNKVEGGAGWRETAGAARQYKVRAGCLRLPGAFLRSPPDTSRLTGGREARREGGREESAPLTPEPRCSVHPVSLWLMPRRGTSQARGPTCPTHGTNTLLL
ncbi:hypothetical protein E2C01_059293 [Portunus trituberculatus]|uniref:Uncharacterized protein n=1 Tax=Portunus trituberculatus TaxID=210409 RepID=A0A5B7H4Y7_PORTR|nr:hypothetical protein [Portunus trituberculatus]